MTSQPYPLDIDAKVAWINARFPDVDLAVDIDLDMGDSGTAAFALPRPDTLQLADLLADHLARATGLRCRGGMDEVETFVRRLRFLHGIRCRGVLVELCSMNTDDAKLAKRPGAKARFAHGLAAGCLEALSVPR